MHKYDKRKKPYDELGLVSLKGSLITVLFLIQEIVHISVVKKLYANFKLDLQSQMFGKKNSTYH